MIKGFIEVTRGEIKHLVNTKSIAFVRPRNDTQALICMLGELMDVATDQSYDEICTLIREAM